MSNQDTLCILLQLESSLRSEFASLLHAQPLSKLSPDARLASLTRLIEWMTANEHTHPSLFKRLMRLDAAYCQLELGLYGLCADCEVEMETERLSQDPTLQRCTPCDVKYHGQHRQELRLDH